MRPRQVFKSQRGLAAVIILVMMLQMAAVAIYLFAIAPDRYVSTIGMSVRTDTNLPDPAMFDGMSVLSGGAKTDGAILYSYLNSTDMIRRIDRRIGLKARLVPPTYDPLFAGTLSSAEDIQRRWAKMTHVTFDSRNGLVSVQVSGFTAMDALMISQAIVEESSAMLQRLSAQARAETTNLARSELSKAEGRLQQARQNLTDFRVAARIVDPTADLAGQFGVMASLQAEMAEAQIALGVLQQSSTDGDPRLVQAIRRVEVVSALLNAERQKFGLGNDGFAAIVARFEDLQTEVDYAHESYLMARSALDGALVAAQQAGRHLAVHISPVQAETASLPNRPKILGLTAVGLGLVWAVIFLGIQGFRQKRE